MAERKKSPSPFALALAARRGDIPHESLSGAARLLYKDNSLSNDRLQEYSAEKAIRQKSFERVNQTFKRG